MNVVYVLRLNHAKYLNFTILYVIYYMYYISSQKKSKNLSFTPACETVEPTPACVP